MMAPLARLRLTYNGAGHVCEYDPAACTTVGDLQGAIQALLPPSLAADTIKLLPQKRGASGGVVHLVRDAGKDLDVAGIAPDAGFLVLASSAAELAAVQAAKELPRLRGFEHEEALAAARRARALSSAALEQRPHCFGAVEPWQHPGLRPGPPAARTLLLQLATDPAIVAVMRAHGWRVGRLSEMPPQGRVGVSAVCVLGYNVNRGAEISLRLRTDDLKGFRKYAKIRETLVHELTHNVWGDHDSNFKQLNSQLLKEVAAHEAASTAAGRLLGAAGASPSGSWLGDDDDGDDGGDGGGGEEQRRRLAPAMAASAASSGRTLAQLAGSPAPSAPGSVQQAAAAAAAARWQAAQARAPPPPPPAAVADDDGAAAAASAGPRPRSHSPDVIGGDGEGAWGEVEAAMQHEDAATAVAEAEMQRLGSLDDTTTTTPPPTPTPPAAAAPAPAPRGGGGGQHAGGEAQPALLRSEQRATDAGAAAGPPVPEQRSAPACASGPAAAGPAPPEAEPMQLQGESWEGDWALADPVLAEKLSRVRAALARLACDVPPPELAALKRTLQDILRRLAQQPRDPRFQLLRLSNPAFLRRVGRYEAALDILRVAGFEARRQPTSTSREHPGGAGGGQAQEEEPVLVYTRHDPGLLWLVQSAVA